MEAKFVISYLFFFFHFSGSAQEKYIYYNPGTDTIFQTGNVTYYKISGNLFDIDRYAQMDTINSNLIDHLKISTVEDLWKDAKESAEETIQNIEDGKPIPVIDTYNLIFKEIYILEEISSCQFKKIRVWWVDY